MRRHLLTLAAIVTAAAATAAAATATAPPVGKLPPAKTVAYKTIPGKVLTFTLPRPAVKGGVWRIARVYDGAVVHELGERRLKNGSVRITLETTGPGTTRVVFAVTRGETARAYAARIFEITVGDKPPPETR
jgi:hypothetical protein